MTTDNSNSDSLIPHDRARRIQSSLTLTGTEHFKVSVALPSRPDKKVDLDIATSSWASNKVLLLVMRSQVLVAQCMWLIDETVIVRPL